MTLDSVKEFFVTLWKTLLSWYNAYTSFVYSILPAETGDFAIFIINTTAVILFVLAVSRFAFRRK